MLFVLNPHRSKSCETLRLNSAYPALKSHPLATHRSNIHRSNPSYSALKSSTLQCVIFLVLDENWTPIPMTGLPSSQTP